MTPQPKEQFIQKMKILLKDKKDLDEFFKTAKTLPFKSIRVNTLKISPDDLIKRLKEYNWNVIQPYKDHPEIIQITSNLNPGELGKSKEHLLGYYYVQEITSMMPILALNPNENDILLDLCASPGSKTTQAAALMNNNGNIIANDLNIGRIIILSANLERFGITNTIITRHDGEELCAKLNKNNVSFDKILIDAPCSGEGNIRCSPRTSIDWNEKLVNKFSKNQIRIANSGVKLLKPNCSMIYSTCTHSPEENEIVVQHLLDNNNLKIEPVTLPIKTRPGLTKYKEHIFNKDMKHAIRIYHHDNNLEGFFLCKLKKIK
ncbi:RsmB/NOP family class I SAM-dependent RNA methyltransferase [Candidatus Pacearchaeota archaeon]|nr:RsmB/NOP family class I SAM-dependent RNA methyltransferase [Candidatus Pacearchaeota archaeon]